MRGCPGTVVVEIDKAMTYVVNTVICLNLTLSSFHISLILKSFLSGSFKALNFLSFLTRQRIKVTLSILNKDIINF